MFQTAFKKSWWWVTKFGGTKICMRFACELFCRVWCLVIKTFWPQNWFKVIKIYFLWKNWHHLERIEYIRRAEEVHKKLICLQCGRTGRIPLGALFTFSIFFSNRFFCPSPENSMEGRTCIARVFCEFEGFNWNLEMCNLNFWNSW